MPWTFEIKDEILLLCLFKVLSWKARLCVPLWKYKTIFKHTAHFIMSMHITHCIYYVQSFHKLYVMMESNVHSFIICNIVGLLTTKFYNLIFWNSLPNVRMYRYMTGLDSMSYHIVWITNWDSLWPPKWIHST